MSDSKNDHFVSQLILRGFLNLRGRLFAFDKRRPNVGIRETHPKNVFAENCLNSSFGKDGTKDRSLEKWYASLEDKVGPIVAKIVSAARAGKLPGLTESQRSAWDEFVYHQAARSPDAFARLVLEDKFRDELPSRLEDYEREVRPPTPQERSQLHDPKNLKRVLQNVRVAARGLNGPLERAALAARGIAVALIVPSNKSFIIGDYPQVRMGPRSYLRDPETELCFPVAWDVAVSPCGKPMTEKLIGLDGEGVRGVNRAMFQQSNIVAARSQALIESLASSR